MGAEGMIPVAGGYNKQNTCSDITPSSCIAWSGAPIPGLCIANPTLTDVIAQISNNSNCCKGSFPIGHQSCYTNTWIDFSSSIPSSGLASGVMAYTIGGISVQYKWDSLGNLFFRGNFDTITFTPNYTSEQVGITLTTLSLSCLPTNATKKWVTLGGQAINITNSALGIVNFYLQFDITTGNTILAILYVGPVTGIPISLGSPGVTYGLSFDSAQFNFA